MKLSGRRGLAVWLIALAFFLGCVVPPSAAQPPLSAAAARKTLDSWNPSYCKVAEFYGLHKPEAAGTSLVAYVALINPAGVPKPVVYAATFQLLIRPDGQPQWFLTSLVTHGSGFLTKRQGWDAIMIPVQEAGSEPKAVSSKK